MKKRVLSLFLALVLSVSMVPMTAFAEETGAATAQEAQNGGDTADVSPVVEDISGGNASGKDVAVQAAQGGEHTGHPICGNADCSEHGQAVTDWEEIKDENGLRAVTEGGYYYLTDSITLTAAWIPANGTVLDLNGHSITGDVADIVTITVPEGASFTLTDCKGGGTITHSSGKNGSGVEVLDGGTFAMYGGVISGNTADYGGGVSMGGKSVFTMYGGSISGNTANTLGGGVFVDASSTFQMSDGQIYDNKAGDKGGGVFVEGTFTMTDGTIGGVSIPGNEAVNGGGVYVNSNGVFRMGGSNYTPNVYGNCVSVSGKGSGVYVDGTLELFGGVQVLNNDGGDSSDVYLPGDKTIRITGKLINEKTVGVTLENPPAGEGSYVIFAEGENYRLTDDDTKAFFYNNDYRGETYNVQCGDNRLRMYRGESHGHTICVGSGCTDDSHDKVFFDALTYDATNKTLKYGGMLLSASTGYYPLTNGSWYLTGDLELDAPLRISGDVRLCLNGYRIILKAEGNVIEIGDSNDATNAMLTLCDCKRNGTVTEYGRITHGTDVEGSQYFGRGVMLRSKNSGFTMYGGAITGNALAENIPAGAGVYVRAASNFTMYGGEISGNKITEKMGGMGGGVYIIGTTSIGGNAKIFDNQADFSGGSGGGAYVTGRGTLMIGGNAQITGNKVISYGGGIYAYDGAKLYVSGNVQVTGNQDGYFDSQGGSNVFLYSADTPISVNGPLGSDAKIGVTLFDSAYPQDDGTVIFAKTVSDTGESGTGWIQTGHFISDYSSFYKLNVSGDGTTASFALHDHIWKIRKNASANILEERCTVGSCNTLGGTLTLTANDGDYTGSPYAASWAADDKWHLPTEDVKISYEEKSSSGTFTALTEAPTACGDYRATLTLGGVSVTKEFSIQPGTLAPGDFIFDVPEDLVYDGQPKTATVTLRPDIADAAGTVTVKYYDKYYNLITDAEGNPAKSVTEAGTYTVAIDVTAGDSYKSVSNMNDSTWTFIVGRRSVAITGIKAKDKIYDGTTKAVFDYSQVGFEGKLDGDTLTVEIQGYFADKNVGENKNVRIAGMILGGESMSNYQFGVDSLPTLTADITPKELTITDVTVEDKAYDGTTEAVVTDVTFDGLVSGETLTAGTDYTANGTFTDAVAGTGKDVKATVRLADSVKNYMFAGGSTGVEYDKRGCTIRKAAVADPAPMNFTIVNIGARTYRTALPNLPALESPREYGSCAYSQPLLVISDEDYAGKATVSKDDGQLQLEITGTGSTIGSIGTVTVAVETDNYEKITLTVNVMATDRIVPQPEEGTLTLSPAEITYGDALKTITISGTMKDGDTEVPGNFLWQNGDDVLTAGTHTDVAWKFTPADSAFYAETTGFATVRVNKAAQSGAVSMKSYRYNATPGTPALTGQTGDSNATVTYYYSTTDRNSGGTEWKDIQPPALDAGTYYMYAVIGETANYKAFTTPAVEFKVWKAVPNYIKPTGLTAKCGQKLSEIPLPNPEGSMAGEWSWQAPETVIDKIGTLEYDADFKPYNMNYLGVADAAIKITVEPGDGRNLATVELTQAFGDASEHTYTPDWSALPAGQTWNYDCEYSVSSGSTAALTVQKMSATNGELTYAVSGGKAGDRIAIALKAQCDNYEDFTVTLNITITKADAVGEPKYTVITAEGKTLKDAGLTVKDSTLKPADGRLEWIDDAGNVLPEDTKVEVNKTYKWRFTPADDNYTTLTGEITPYPVYRILDGANSSWTQNTDGSIKIRGNGPISKFVNVKVDGMIVDPVNYTVTEGSTIIEFKPEYLKTLSEGSHTFEMFWTDGSASTSFTVAKNTSGGDDPGNKDTGNDDSGNKDTGNNNAGGNSSNDNGGSSPTAGSDNASQTPVKSPKTGDASGLWILLFLASAAGLAVMLVRRKKQ